ncbi:hypothetical protein GUJ93_ZPchr0011g28803 [Zizania palustris]|uniref:Uncharacterized protein n=1 Tax=Zizania palustris TaxID=103762 RepID=A0A8J5WIV1_ZIZPA|nr:hypothetical protein GUJ93_ZPchr0011g28803 [Zizania palustris]
MWSWRNTSGVGGMPVMSREWRFSDGGSDSQQDGVSMLISVVVYDGCQTWETAFIIQAFCSTGLVDEFSSTLEKAYGFLKHSQVLHDLPNGKSFYRHRSKASATACRLSVFCRHLSDLNHHLPVMSHALLSPPSSPTGADLIRRCLPPLKRLPAAEQFHSPVACHSSSFPIEAACCCRADHHR